MGVGRSGTTLLQNMLNSHSNLAFIPEINYPRRFLFNRKLEKIYNKDKSDFHNYIRNDKWFSRLDEKLINKLNLESNNYTEFSTGLFMDILSVNCKINGKSIAGYKDPRSIELVGKIDKVIPDINWIHIVRDPRDVLLSKMKSDWSKDSTVLKHIFASYVQFDFTKKWKQKLPNTFAELYYEDLISDPESTLKTLCTSIGLEYDPKMLNYTKSAKILIAKDELSWKKEVFLPIMQSNHSKWKKELNIWQVALVEKLVEPVFTNYDYNRSFPSLNIFQRLKLILLKFIFSILSKLYICVRMK